MEVDGVLSGDNIRDGRAALLSGLCARHYDSMAQEAVSCICIYIYIYMQAAWFNIL